MMLRHATHYGLKYIFVHDPYYEPLVSFAGWQKVETYDSGSITFGRGKTFLRRRPIPSDAMPTAIEGIMWGIFHWEQHSGDPVRSSDSRSRASAQRGIRFPRSHEEEQRARPGGTLMNRLLPIVLVVVTGC